MNTSRPRTSPLTAVMVHTGCETPWRKLSHGAYSAMSTNHPVIIVLHSAVRDYVSQTYELDRIIVDNVLGPAQCGVNLERTSFERHITCYGIESVCAHRLTPLSEVSIRQQTPRQVSDIWLRAGVYFEPRYMATILLGFTAIYFAYKLF